MNGWRDSTSIQAKSQFQESSHSLRMDAGNGKTYLEDKDVFY
ncbi:hypothetical protein HMPREF0620_0482 [Parascardovia denticolens DSM 10105 = JCM 12538]|uniref:Uncharacterized protein n=1 Tax=Parascardovia denticolens DSM 10105 = JCM 12538 TaxID=864564 RepID=E6K0Z6_PARDN|nr:hypothetical protein HMPREF0620_0482 [Parascardovia denticolens DSM 10105 = JCM 12538]